ncbi:uncharacterized protein JCM15063_001654 [Sporobolomyces koalae]|uniref:uncharacterized protein n=1 Tax=Sporobolomyces koalae TaxID=500713 RepID=UPI0031709E44
MSSAPPRIALRNRISPSTDENQPVHSRSGSAHPPARPASTHARSAKVTASRASTRVGRPHGAAPLPAAVEISVQLPSSDGGAATGVSSSEQASQEDPKRRVSTLLPVPANRRRSRSRSRSKSPAILPPSKPTYATLTSRRRSAAALRRQSVAVAAAADNASPRDIEPESVLELPSTVPVRDELLLLPPEQNRGPGEGKEGIQKKWDRERARYRRSMSRSVSVDLGNPPSQTPFDQVENREFERIEIGTQEVERVETEEFDYGGYDGAGEFFEQEEHALDSETPAGSLEQSEAPDLRSGSEQATTRGRADLEDARSERNQSKSSTGSRAEHDQDEEDEDRKNFSLLDEPASSSDAERSDADEDLPFPDQPQYAPSDRASTPPMPLKEGQSYTEIFPPLSPNTTGEYDQVEPIRFSSSPPPELDVPSRNSPDPDQARTSPIEPGLPSPFLDRASASDVRQQSSTVEPLPSVPAVKLEQGTSSGALATAASLLSPASFLSRAFSRPRSTTPIDSAPSPRYRPQFNFVPLPSPRNRPRLQVPRSPAGAAALEPQTSRIRQPSPLANVATANPITQEWTRGPAFFRSSSFTPPPARSSFDRKGKAKAVDQDAQSDGEDEESREYWRPGAMTGTSPHLSDRGRDSDAESEPSQADGQDEPESRSSPIRSSLGKGSELPGPPTPSKSRTSSPKTANLPAPPTPTKELASSSPRRSRGQSGDESDASMNSPAASLRSRQSTRSESPPRSPGGDLFMSSPVGSVRSIRSIDMSLSPHDPRKKLPATPPDLAIAALEEQAMLSPSPARNSSAPRAQSLRRSPSKLEELVGAGRDKLTGLLSFGSPRRTITPVASTSEAQIVADETRAADSEVTSLAGEPAVQGDDNDDDQPFPLAQTRHSHDVSTVSNLSYAGTTSTRLSRSRRNLEHPSLPVIEISSTDAKAAARAAAILKVYHKYVEQGIEGSLARDEASRIIRDAERQGNESSRDHKSSEQLHGESEEEEEEEELRTLLLDAEEEVRNTFGRGLSDQSTSSSSSSRQRTETEEEEEEEEEVRSVLLSNRSSSPATSQRAVPPSVASHARSRSVSSESASSLSSVVGARWTSQEWRRLEQTLVEVKRKSKGQGREVEAEEVVEAFLTRWGVEREECEGDWEWDKLLIRVEAIKARRAKDVRTQRLTSQASMASAAATDDENSVETVTMTRDHSASPIAIAIKEEDDDEQDQLSLHAGRDSGSDSGDEEYERIGDALDDTFFSNNRRLRRTRRTSMPHTRLPTALSNPRLAHIYEDAPAPEKPRLPIKELLEREASLELRLETPEPQDPEPEVQQPLLSAQRIFSYLGSFVRRSPAPSPTSSKFAPTSSISPEPEPEPEMVEARTRPAVVTPRAVDTGRSSLRRDREIRPLPHASESSLYTSVASTSQEHLDVPEGTLRRRRSSGEGRVWEAVNAIEEAESSREEEEARIIELLQSGSAKRKASKGDLRKKVGDGGRKGKGRAVEPRIESKI